MITLYTVNGAGGIDTAGYQADIAATLTDPVNDWAAQCFGDAFANKCYWQPVGYKDNPVPMQPGIDAGVTEHVRLLTDIHPTGPILGCYYSEGAIIGSIVLDLMRGVDNAFTQRYAKLPSITHRYSDFLGATTFGNPRREEGHTLPGVAGAIDNGGSGIVTPNMVDTPDTWWDFACDSKMIGAPGDDLYTKCGKGITAQATADQRLVWQIVLTGSFTSIIGLTEAVWALIQKLGLDFSGDVGAVEAAINALDFFVVHGITPHTSYQFTQPVAGDSRDCWAMGCDHLAQLAGQALAAPPP